MYNQLKFAINDDTYYYLAFSDITEEEKNILIHKLPPSEQAKYMRFRQIADKEMFLCGRTILRNELENELHLNYNIELDFNEYQKPELNNFPYFNFNISHSNGIVLVAFSKFPVGADIEKVVTYDKTTIIQSLSNFAFHNEEIEFLEKLNETDAQYAFTKIWNIKESLIKAAGKGLSIDTKSFLLDCVHLNPINPNLLEIVNGMQELEQQNINYYTTLYSNNYFITISTLTPIPQG
ncbi:MAG: 4'-phosphopantetheinyl transferase superfamily protein [Ignavibacteria bacterium]|jgi:4'-phosphopantetheinyl transferase|nr:4'-phosphopantetheinyl transferase superfamily protein [Ignavibacteria bacterium]